MTASAEFAALNLRAHLDTVNKLNG